MYPVAPLTVDQFRVTEVERYDDTVGAEGVAVRVVIGTAVG